jgi:dTDP-4-dehydrorhamnose 3,5-epimerase
VDWGIQRTWREGVVFRRRKGVEMRIEETALPGVYLIEPKRFGDARGFFSEVYKKHALLEAGIDLDFIQDNHSLSAERGVVRGLHFQAPPHAQDKLVRVVRGRILDVAVDIRRGSPNYGRFFSIELSAENGLQLLVPKGFLHGFATLEPNCEVLYKVTDVYAPDCEGGVIWNDPDLGIDWGLADDEVVLSDKDKLLPGFKDFESPFE